MASSPRSSVSTPRCWRALALTLAWVLAAGTIGFAQSTELLPSPSTMRDALARPIAHDSVETRHVDLRRVLVERDEHEPFVEGSMRRPTSSQQRLSPPAARNGGSRARRVTGAVIGAIAGFWIGAELGPALADDRCHCEEMGVLRGASVGTAAGAVLGALLIGK